jgi:hypothetical protein
MICSRRKTNAIDNPDFLVLAMRGTTPFKSPKPKGAHLDIPSGNPLMYLFDGAGGGELGHFFNNIAQTKNSVWALNKAFFHCLRPQKGGGGKHVFMK